jgi:two-component system LytT family response regulator
MPTSDAITVVVADDEPVARRGIRDMLADVSWVTCVGEAASGPATIEAINSLKPDLVFLDIQMPGMLGTEVLKHVKKQPHVIFTTAFAEHAVTAFELGALDYLLKPFGQARLEKALERARAAFGEPGGPTPFDRLSEAFATGPMTRLFVRLGATVVPIAVDSVTRFDADGDYVTAFSPRGKHLLHLSLNRLEARLDSTKFARVHRSHIVNLSSVTTFRTVKGRLVAEMADGAKVAVSRERARDLRRLGV